jgi:hypothetical protein
MRSMRSTIDPVLLEAQACMRERRMPPEVSLRLLFAGLIAREQSEARLRRWVLALTVTTGFLLALHLNPAASGSSLKDLLSWASALGGIP